MNKAEILIEWLDIANIEFTAAMKAKDVEAMKKWSEQIALAYRGILPMLATASR